MKKRTIYHGGSQIVSEPEIRIAKYHKDFYYGFHILNGNFDNIATCKYTVPGLQTAF